jgi:hypothetical protein
MLVAASGLHERFQEAHFFRLLDAGAVPRLMGLQMKKEFFRTLNRQTDTRQKDI